MAKYFLIYQWKNKEEAYEAITEMVRNSNYMTGNLWDCKYFSKRYKVIATDLSKKLIRLTNRLKNLD